MTIAETYAALGRLLDYPTEKKGLQTDHAVISAFLENRQTECAISSFADLVDAAPLAALQEEYVATFDFNPATAPYLGHHLFGDNQKKGGYMIRLKQEYARHGFTPSTNELPDHLPVVLGFLAHLTREENAAQRRPFIADLVLPGMEKLSAVFATRPECPWKPLIEAALFVCSADCKEVTPC
jgi:nitrate reductase molybdenum cofactor assembly chaperone NarJ/NarW